MFGVLCVIGGVAFLAYLIYLAVNEDSKKCNAQKLGVSTSYDTNMSFEDIVKKLKAKFEGGNSGDDEIVFKELKSTCFHFNAYAGDVSLHFKSGHLVISRYGFRNDCKGDVLNHLEQNYSQYTSLKERCYYFLLDLLKEGTSQPSSSSKIKEVFKLHGFYNSSYWGVETINDWISINDGEYYAITVNGMYKLENWSYISSDEAWEIIKDAKLEKSEAPDKVHWEHFLKLEMLAKKQREKDMQEFVDSILSKQVKYNDLQLQFEMLPTAPIADIETFTNFCKIVKEDVNYEPHEIQNYLFMKKLK